MKLFPLRLPALAGRSTRPQQIPPPAATHEAPPQAPTPDAGPGSGSGSHKPGVEGSTPSPAPTAHKVTREELRTSQREARWFKVTRVSPVLIRQQGGNPVQTPGGAIYAVDGHGNLQRVDKVRLTKKERRRARARQRELAAKPVEDIQAAVAAAAE